MVSHPKLIAALAVGLATWVVQPAAAVTLTYKAENKWVAAEDNAPLLELMSAAKNGQARFTASLPTTNRNLAVTRLIIIRDILAREAGAPVVIQESGPTAKTNTLVIQ